MVSSVTGANLGIFPVYSCQSLLPMYKILLLLDYASEFERNILRGLVKYSSEHGPWLFYRLPPSFRATYGDEGIIRYAREWKADAVIGRWDNDELDIRRELHIPVVYQNYHHRRVDSCNLTGDYRSAGMMAAQFFFSKGYRNLAYMGIEGVVWSCERRDAFREYVQTNGGDFSCFEYGPEEDSGLRSRLRNWLESLPKPVALFCCDDENALYVSETCKICGLRIPDDISLLGVDNDELICNISDPPISSVELNVKAGGYALGRLIHEMINGEFAGVRDVVISPVRIEPRRSTEKYDIRDPYIRKVMQRIDNEFATDLTVADLLADVPMSRRNIEVKFRKAVGTSIWQYLLGCRCRYLANLLITTDRQLIDLASEAGFSDYTNIARAFRKIFGCSPKEYRNRNLFAQIDE